MNWHHSHLCTYFFQENIHVNYMDLIFAICRQHDARSLIIFWHFNCADFVLPSILFVNSVFQIQL